MNRAPLGKCKAASIALGDRITVSQNQGMAQDIPFCTSHEIKFIIHQIGWGSRSSVADNSLTQLTSSICTIFVEFDMRFVSRTPKHFFDNWTVIGDTYHNQLTFFPRLGTVTRIPRAVTGETVTVILSVNPGIDNFIDTNNIKASSIPHVNLLRGGP